MILIYIFTQCSPCLSLGKTANLHYLTLARSRPVNGHVFIPHEIGHFLLVVFRTKPLSPAFLKILGPKNNWVTTLTFLGHVTSSVTWPFDSPYPTSYWCSIATKPLSLTFFEIFGSKVPVQCKSSLRMRDITWPVPPRQNLGTFLNFPPPHCLFTMTLFGLRWRIRGVYSWDPNVKREIRRKFSKSRPKFGKFWRFWGLGVRGIKKLRFLSQKARSCVNPRRLSHFASKLVRGCDLQVGWGKKSQKVTETPIGKTCGR